MAFLRFIVGALFAITVIYILFAVVNSTFNAFEWPADSKHTWAFFTVIGGFLFGIFCTGD